MNKLIGHIIFIVLIGLLFLDGFGKYDVPFMGEIKFVLYIVGSITIGVIVHGIANAEIRKKEKDEDGIG